MQCIIVPFAVMSVVFVVKMTFKNLSPAFVCGQMAKSVSITGVVVHRMCAISFFFVFFGGKNLERKILFFFLVRDNYNKACLLTQL